MLGRFLRRIKHFSAVSSDNAGNTRLTRELLEEEFSWLIHFADACHQMHNTAKDIVALLVFSDANSKLRAVIRYFRKSSYASHHLTAWRHILNISKGLLTIGKTRFLMWFYAIDHFLPCLQIIVDLVRSKVIKTTATHPLHFLNSTSTTREFTDRLEQERAILEPFARAVKCLESSASTPADVCLFWLACQATLNDLFTDETKRDILMLTEDLIADVRAIVNARFGEMIEGPDRQVYLTTLFLDPHYVGSPLFTRKHINPLSTTISIPGSRPLGSSSSTNTRRLPDADLRASLPAYVSSGAYLGQILVNEINASRLPEEITSSYDGADAIIEEFRIEFESYTRQRPPFDRYTDSPTPFVYWTRQARHFDACVLAFLGLKLYSIVPNSMAEERTISNFTKLNSPDRGRQRPSTLVFMTQIKQHQQRERKAPGSAHPTNPTVRFRDLSDILRGQSTPTTREGAAGAEVNQAHNAIATPAQDDASASNPPGSADPDEWDKAVGLDEEIERPPPGARDRFTFAEADGVNLDEPLLLDLLSDDPIPGVVARGGYTINHMGSMSATTTSSGASGSFTAKSFQF